MDSDTPYEDIDGIILSIHMKNFFCHDNLFVDLRPKNNINVHSIIGDNGSGKSTILTALVIGLGGRAITTFRGNNLQSFIKRNKTTASIEIAIKNNSSRAYKHDIYGDTITIVRTINASGGSYKILSESGVCVSTKASDVKEIAVAHDIQVENPISVLNQDDARTFLGTSAKDKYAAFRRATNFAQTEEFYNKAQENCNKADVILSRKKEAFSELSREYKKLKIKYDQMIPQEEIENEIRQLENELRWFDVAKLQHEVDYITREWEKHRTLCQKLAGKLKEIEEEFGNNAGALESLKQQLSEPTARRGGLERALREAEAEARRAAERARAAREARNHTDVRLQRERRQTADLSEAIRQIESGGDDGASRRETLERTKEEALAAVEETRARIDTGQHEEEQARENAVRAAQEAESAHAAVKGDEYRLEQAKRELQSLRQRSADSLAVFGTPMVQLCERVGDAVREGRFSLPPRGPVGKFLKVRNMEWASALEHIIGNAINYFCVNTAADSRQLFDIMAKVYGQGRKPGVTCSAFRSQVHDVSARRVRAPGGTCALDALEITDPVVANYLIDNLELETVLLVADHDDAVRLSDSVQNVPANCSKVVTKDCTDYMPAPRYRIYGGLGRPPQYLNTSTVDRTRQMAATIADLEKAVAEKSSEAQHLARKEETARRAQDRAAKALHALQSNLRKMERAARDADEALQQHSAPQQAVLEEKYEICKGNVTKLEEEIRKLTDKEQILVHQKNEADARVAEIVKELEGVKSEYRSLQGKTDQKQLGLDQLATEKASYEQRVKEETDRLQRVEATLETRRQALTDGKESLGPRPAILREKAEVQSQLGLMKRQQAVTQDSALSREDVRAQLDDVTHRYTRVKEELRAIGDLVDKINKLTKKHLELCYTLQTNIARHVEFKFTNTLKLRNYMGRIHLDHAEGEMYIYLNDTSKKLSGGERSYFTIALFIAMWECIELPFYFMDEFDVFMDGVNRTTAWQLLVDSATKRKGRQFVFLTQKALPIDKDATIGHSLPSPSVTNQ